MTSGNEAGRGKNNLSGACIWTLTLVISVCHKLTKIADNTTHGPSTVHSGGVSDVGDGSIF